MWGAGGRWEQSIPHAESPGPCNLGQGLHCEVLRETSLPGTLEGSVPGEQEMGQRGLKGTQSPGRAAP